MIILGSNEKITMQLNNNKMKNKIISLFYFVSIQPQGKPSKNIIPE